MNQEYIHPLLVHFPIALLVTGGLAYVASILLRERQFGSWMSVFGSWAILIGTVGACFAVTSGFLFTEEMEGIMEEVRDTHILFALSTLMFGVITSVFIALSLFYSKFRYEKYRYLVLLLILLTAVCVGVTGHYGGVLVFGY